MATCPECGSSSREFPNAIVVEKVLVAKPLGTWSLAGQSPKTVAAEAFQMSCWCGWSVLGHISDDGKTFIASIRTPREPT